MCAWLVAGEHGTPVGVWGCRACVLPLVRVAVSLYGRHAAWDIIEGCIISRQRPKGETPQPTLRQCRCTHGVNALEVREAHI